MQSMIKIWSCYLSLSHPIPSHPIPSYPIPSHPIPSHSIPLRPIRTCSLVRKDSIIAFQYQYLVWLLGIGHFEVARQVQVVGMSRALWSLLGRYGFTHWLLRGCARNWVKISLAKQSHSAIGLATLWSRVIFHVYLHEVKWQPWEKWLTIGSISISGTTPKLPTPNPCFFHAKATR